MKVVYIAGPFRGKDGWEVNRNVHAAECAAREVAHMGAAPLTPHSIGAHMDDTETPEFWSEATAELLRRSDIMLVLPGYEKSAGTLGELKIARARGMHIVMPVRIEHQWSPDFARLRLLFNIYGATGDTLDCLGGILDCYRDDMMPDGAYLEKILRLF